MRFLAKRLLKHTVIQNAESDSIRWNFTGTLRSQNFLCDTVFMLSAVFGGREFVDKNQTACSIGFAIDQNTIRACHESGTVERINYGSSACVYPRSLNKPVYLLKESDILSTGEGLESSGNLYGLQKIMTELTL